MKNKFKINILNILKFFFYIFPLAILIPSGYLTAYVSILTIIALIYFYKSNKKIKFFFPDYLVFCLFGLSSLSSLININEIGYFLFFKSILDIRFAILFLIIRNVINYRLVNIKYLLATTLFSTTFLCFDIFSQHYFGYDIFGYKPFDGRYNGSFADEAIAGSYIQKFSLLSILMIFYFPINKIVKNILLCLLINLLGLGIFLSLDRMPVIVYLFSLILAVIFLKNYRYLFLINIIFLLITFFYIFNSYSVVKNRYISLKFEYERIKNSQIIKSDNNKEAQPEGITKYLGYYDLYKSSYYVWKENNWIIGSGIKSFSINCRKINSSDLDLYCSTHPHNIYLEILTNTGILGLIIFVTILITLSKEHINNFIKQHYIINTLLFLLLISETIPIRSFGSIFQTVNGSIFWFLLSLISIKKFYISEDIIVDKE